MEVSMRVNTDSEYQQRLKRIADDENVSGINLKGNEKNEIIYSLMTKRNIFEKRE